MCNNHVVKGNKNNILCRFFFVSKNIYFFNYKLNFPQAYNNSALLAG